MKVTQQLTRQDYQKLAGKLRDKRMPLWKKLLVLFGVLYLYMPIDLVIDAIPVAGISDDAFFVYLPFLLQRVQEVMGARKLKKLSVASQA